MEMSRQSVPPQEENFGTVVDRLRRERGLTLRELADRTFDVAVQLAEQFGDTEAARRFRKTARKGNWSVSYYSRIIQGDPDAKPGAILVMAIAEVLGVDPDVFMEMIGEVPVDLQQLVQHYWKDFAPLFRHADKIDFPALYKHLSIDPTKKPAPLRWAAHGREYVPKKRRKEAEKTPKPELEEEIQVQRKPVEEEPPKVAALVTEEKECPDCAEMVKARARICRYCQHEFE